MDNFPIQSAEIGELVKALVKAKISFNKLTKSKDSIYKDANGKKTTYATIDDINNATEKSLCDNGLTVTQGRIIDNQMNVILLTSLVHISGQYRNAYMPLGIPANPRNGIDAAWGSTTSYQRRYELYAILGLGSGEDSDPDSDPDTLLSQSESLPLKNPSKITDLQLQELKGLFNEGDKESSLDVLSKIKVDNNINSLQELPQSKFGIVKGYITKNLKKRGTNGSITNEAHG